MPNTGDQGAKPRRNLSGRTLRRNPCHVVLTLAVLRFKSPADDGADLFCHTVEWKNHLIM